MLSDGVTLRFFGVLLCRLFFEELLPDGVPLHFIGVLLSWLLFEELLPDGVPLHFIGVLPCRLFFEELLSGGESYRLIGVLPWWLFFEELLSGAGALRLMDCAKVLTAFCLTKSGTKFDHCFGSSANRPSEYALKLPVSRLVHWKNHCFCPLHKIF